MNCELVDTESLVEELQILKSVHVHSVIIDCLGTITHSDCIVFFYICVQCWDCVESFLLLDLLAIS